MKEQEYNRTKAIEYAKKWAYGRNPAYYNFDSVGGDCTSFVSQCIYEGAKIMNYDKIKGWYYSSGNDKSPSWSGVEYLYKFLVNNKSIGPYGKETNTSEIEEGDIAQISFDGNIFAHTLFIINKQNMQVATHTFDSYGRSLNTYNYKKIRFIHIQKVRIW